MSDSHVQDDLIPYALGELSGQNFQRVEEHVDSCRDCRCELEETWRVLGIFGMSEAQSVLASPAFRKRLLKKIRTTGARAEKLHWRFAESFVIAALLIVAATLAFQNRSLRQLHAVEARLASPEITARAVQRLLASPDTMYVTLRPAAVKLQPQAQAVYVSRTASLVFVATGLRPVPPGKAYELWLLPVGGKPVPSGVFKPDAQGQAAVVNPPLPLGLQAKGFAVTVENETGSEQPTSPILLVGAI